MNFRDFLLPFLNFWPPFLFTGIRVKRLSKDYRHMSVTLNLSFWNANFFSTQYGGSIFSMTDPFFVLMLYKNLGPNFILWDKSAHIRFLKPGRTRLIAEFKLSEEDIEAVRQSVEKEGRINWIRKIEVKNTNGEVIAVVVKTIYIALKTVRP